MQESMCLRMRMHACTPRKLALNAAGTRSLMRLSLVDPHILNVWVHKTLHSLPFRVEGKTVFSKARPNPMEYMPSHTPSSGTSSRSKTLNPKP